jgi:ATP-binding cassette, subfamily B, multidrug efflux pump
VSKERREDKPAGGPFGRGPMLSMAMPPEKVKDFKGTLKRLAGYLKALLLQANYRIDCSGAQHSFQHCQPENHGPGYNKFV